MRVSRTLTMPNSAATKKAFAATRRTTRMILKRTRVTMAFNHILAGRRGRKGKGAVRVWAGLSQRKIGEQGLCRLAFWERQGEEPGEVQNRWRAWLGLKLRWSLRSQGVRKFAFFYPDFRSKAIGS